MKIFFSVNNRLIPSKTMEPIEYLNKAQSISFWAFGFIMKAKNGNSVLKREMYTIIM